MADWRALDDRDRFELAGAAVSVLRAVTAEAPGLLVLDDLHGADQGRASELLDAVAALAPPDDAFWDLLADVHEAASAA